MKISLRDLRDSVVRAHAVVQRELDRYQVPVAIARAAARAATEIADAKSPARVTSAVATLATDLREVGNPDRYNDHHVGRWPLAQDQILSALEAGGMRPSASRGHVRGGALEGFNGNSRVFARVDSGSVYVSHERHAAFVERLLERHVATLGHIAFNEPPAQSPGTWSMRALSLDVPVSDQARAIADLTLPVLEHQPHRGILLNGRPGVGKSTAALAIAREVIGRFGGRAVLVPQYALSSTDIDWSVVGATVIVVDDVDKARINLEAIAALRSACRLLIMTANNGEDDSVLDAATVRPARAVDEMFTVTGEPHRRPPFDRVDDATWERIKTWPVAYLQEIAARIAVRGVNPDDLRLDDLEGRLNRRTRSGDHLGATP